MLPPALRDRRLARAAARDRLSSAAMPGSVVAGGPAPVATPSPPPQLALDPRATTCPGGRRASPPPPPTSCGTPLVDHRSSSRRELERDDRARGQPARRGRRAAVRAQSPSAAAGHPRASSPKAAGARRRARPIPDCRSRRWSRTAGRAAPATIGVELERRDPRGRARARGAARARAAPPSCTASATSLENAVRFRAPPGPASPHRGTRRPCHRRRSPVDGPGFPPEHLHRPNCGQPYISTRAGAADQMGLGIFIAQSLLERSGARLVFDNLPEGGAHVAIFWNGANLEMVEKLRPTAAHPHTLRPSELSRGRRQRQDHGD